MGAIVILADDEKDFRSMVREQLTEFGYEVREAENGKVALGLIQKCAAPLSGESVHCVVADYLMPEMDGAGLLVALRSSEILALLPVVIVSGAFDKDSLERLMALDVDGVIFKPFTADKLLDEIDLARTRRERKNYLQQVAAKDRPGKSG